MKNFALDATFTGRLYGRGALRAAIWSVSKPAGGATAQHIESALAGRL